MKMTASHVHLQHLIFQQISGELEGGPQWTHGAPHTWDDIVLTLTSCLNIAQSNKDFGLSFPVGDGLPLDE